MPAMMQSVAFVGVDGLGLATVILAAAPAILSLDVGRRAGIGGLLVVAVVAGGCVVAGEWRLSTASDTWPDVKIRLVQGNIPQREKFKGRQRADHLRHYVALSAGPGAENITHFIWPETAVEFFLSSDQSVRSFLANLADRGAGGDAQVLTGAPRQAMAAGRRQIFNAYHAVDAQGRVVATYDKRHLVPFGEYLPFRTVLQGIGLDKLAHGAIDYQAGTGQSALTLAGLPPARVLVCYEVIFPAEIVTAGEPRPGWLLNVTNDAWFGEISGPYQHFAIARFRAVEQGLPLVRAANTGVSGLVDPFGRTVATIGLGQQGILDLALPKPLPPTVYGRWGDGIVFALWLAAFGLILAATLAGRVRS
jgi:apolipoprotein N-acyltransferase